MFFLSLLCHMQLDAFHLHMNQIVSFDSSLESLKLGSNFAKKNDINNITFVRGDIFDEIFLDQVFDHVITNGVLPSIKEKNIVRIVYIISVFLCVAMRF